jgi:hypothetical protein
MTEEEWLECTDPTPMLAFLRGKTSERKLRLFAVGCCRQIWDLLSDKYNRKALTVAERYADGEVTDEKLAFAWGDARRAAQIEHRHERQTANGSAMWAVSQVCEVGIGRVLEAVGLAAQCKAYPFNPPRLAAAQKEQVSLLRCIFGAPSAQLPSTWLGLPGRAAQLLRWPGLSTKSEVLSGCLSLPTPLRKLEP